MPSAVAETMAVPEGKSSAWAPSAEARALMLALAETTMRPSRSLTSTSTDATPSAALVARAEGFADIACQVASGTWTVAPSWVRPCIGWRSVVRRQRVAITQRRVVVEVCISITLRALGPLFDGCELGEEKSPVRCVAK